MVIGLEDLNIQVPNINERDRVPMAAIKAVVDFIARTFDQVQMDINLSFQHPFGMDILVHTRQEIEYRIPLGDYFLRDIVSKGKVLYERTDP